jgi:hypothetical protein
MFNSSRYPANDSLFSKRFATVDFALNSHKQATSDETVVSNKTICLSQRGEQIL